MGDLDDEWERSELALKKLQIEPQINDQAIFFPSTSSTSTSSSSLSSTSFPSSSSSSSSVNIRIISNNNGSNNSGSNNGNITPITTTTTTGGVIENEIMVDGPEAAINSVLLDALQNPRERMNVLKYEDRILKFVKSKYAILLFIFI